MLTAEKEPALPSTASKEFVTAASSPEAKNKSVIKPISMADKLQSQAASKTKSSG